MKHGWRGRRETLSYVRLLIVVHTTSGELTRDFYGRWSLIMRRTNDFYRLFCGYRGFEKGTQTPNANFAREFNGLGREDTLKV